MKKSMIIRLIVCAALLSILLPIGFATGILQWENFLNLNWNLNTLWRLLIMIACVLLVETLVVFLLGLPHPQNHRARSVLSIVSSLMKYVAGIVILCWGLSILGVNVSTIVASVGIVALVVGFSAESLISDVVTGAFMLFENQYNVGDIVEVGGFRGTVSDIGIRTTSITDLGGNVKIINNSNMKDILNRSDKSSRALSDIQIPYETDVPAFEAQLPDILDRIYEEHQDVMRDKPVYLGVQELGESGVTLRFVVEVEENDIYAVQRVLNRELLVKFREAGVEVPYRQLDLHQK